MNKTVAETVGFCRRLAEMGGSLTEVETLLCPPFTALAAAQRELSGSPVKLGAQNIHWSPSGAFTGEISASMLLELGVSHVIVGHSERRHIMGEDNSMVNKKMKAVLANGLIPVLCVGETAEERREGATERVIGEQLEGALEGVDPAEVGRLIVAYEPVWAIGTGVAASPADAGEAACLIRGRIEEILGSAIIERLQIQYGGSVNEKNISEFVSQPVINGALVGGASLKLESFVALIKAAGEARS